MQNFFFISFILEPTTPPVALSTVTTAKPGKYAVKQRSSTSRREIRNFPNDFLHVPLITVENTVQYQNSIYLQTSFLSSFCLKMSEERLINNKSTR